jgi:hypothetical protein
MQLAADRQPAHEPGPDILPRPERRSLNRRSGRLAFRAGYEISRLGGRFIEIATGSVFEVVSQATIPKRQGFLSEGTYGRVYGAAEKQSRMLSGLRYSLGLAAC